VSKIWVAVATCHEPEPISTTYLGTVTAPDREGAFCLAYDKFLLYEKETIALMPTEDWVGPRIIPLSRLKEFRKDHLEHGIPLGAVVEARAKPCWDIFCTGAGEEVVIGTEEEITLRLYVVGHTRDCDGTPLYVLSAAPIGIPDTPCGLMNYSLFTSFVYDGVSEGDLTDTGEASPKFLSWDDFLKSVRGLGAGPLA